MRWVAKVDVDLKLLRHCHQIDTFKKKLRYKPYVERLYTKPYIKALRGALLRVINHRLVSKFSLIVPQ